MGKRFEWVLAGQAHGLDTICDIDVIGASEAAVIPTLGSLIPGWLLVVPRVEILSVSALKNRERERLLDLADHVGRQLADFGAHIYVFEHGPAQIGSVVGCGSDQAHLHVLASDLDIASSVFADADVQWVEAAYRDPWANIVENSDYYMIRFDGRSYVGYPSEPKSQFFRRHIAAASGQFDAWDYRKFPCYEQAVRTVSQLRATHCSTRDA